MILNTSNTHQKVFTFKIFNYLTYNERARLSSTSLKFRQLFHKYPDHINDDKRFILLPDKEKVELDKRMDKLASIIVYGGIVLIVIISYIFNKIYNYLL